MSVEKEVGSDFVSNAGYSIPVIKIEKEMSGTTPKEDVVTKSLNLVVCNDIVESTHDFSTRKSPSNQALELSKKYLPVVLIKKLKLDQLESCTIEVPIGYHNQSLSVKSKNAKGMNSSKRQDFSNSSSDLMIVEESNICVEKGFGSDFVEYPGHSIPVINVKKEKSSDSDVDTTKNPRRRSQRLSKRVILSYEDSESAGENNPLSTLKHRSNNGNGEYQSTDGSKISTGSNLLPFSSIDSGDALTLRVKLLQKYFKSNKCELCEFVLKDRQEHLVTEHLLTHVNSKNFDNQTDSSSAVNLIKPLEKYFKDNKCLLCGFVSNAKKRGGGKQHLFTHINTKNFECKTCGKRFGTPKLLAIHRASETADSELECDECGRVFSSKTKLSNHKRFHARKVQKCPFCDVVLANLRNLKNHMLIHTGELPHTCLTCGKKFRYKRSYNIHLSIHERVKRFVCEVCNKGFNVKQNYTDHLNIHEGKNEKLTCDTCQKVFNCRPNLLQHKRIHSDLRKYECKICNKKFKFPHHLKNHLQTHILSE